MSETVIREADYYENTEGNRQDIDLAQYTQSGRIRVFSHTAAELSGFRDSFDPIYLEKLDAGETESLVHLLSHQDEEFFLCSADAIVFRVLGNLKLSDRGVSLEEVFGQFKLRRELEYHFTKKFRLRWSQDGLADSLYGGGFKK